jgi:hypothetical protein
MPRGPLGSTSPVKPEAKSQQTQRPDDVDSVETDSLHYDLSELRSIPASRASLLHHADTRLHSNSVTSDSHSQSQLQLSSEVKSNSHSQSKSHSRTQLQLKNTTDHGKQCAHGPTEADIVANIPDVSDNSTTADDTRQETPDSGGSTRRTTPETIPTIKVGDTVVLSFTTASTFPLLAG